MPKSKDDIEQGLLRKGFVKKEGDHHFFIYYNLAGKKKAVFTKTSHTPKMRVLSDTLLSLMAKQCSLSKGNFLRLVDCSLNREEYEKMLSLNSTAG
ncbi:MAG: hypothetical protein WCP34_12365 [Pseudomonadota bacterium]